VQIVALLLKRFFRTFGVPPHFLLQAALNRRYFAESRAQLLTRSQEFAKKQAAQLRRELQRYAWAKPAPALAEVCRRLGLKPVTANRKFPTECRMAHRQRACHQKLPARSQILKPYV
jgi:hypothetical protein